MKKRRLDPRLVEKSLRLSIWESGFFGAMNGLTQNFLVPFALLAGATNLLVSLVATLPGLVGSFLQLWAQGVLRLVRSPRRYLVLFMSAHALVWLLLAFTPFLDHALLPFFLLIIVGAACSLMLSPVWLSYIGELLPVRQRTRFFGTRNAVAGMATFLAMLLAGLLLHVAPVAGFSVLFLLAGFFRAASAWTFWKSVDVPLVTTHSAPLRFARDFGRFLSLAFFLRLAAYLAAPFFAVYQLKVLGLGYGAYTGLAAAVVVSSIVSVRFWARFAEQAGTRRVLQYSTLLTALVPLLWTLTSAYPALFVFELVSGAAWSGFNLASSNYLLEATRRADRTRAVSYFNLFNRVAIVTGGVLGSGLLALFHAFTNGATPFLLLFATSGFLRLAVGVSVRLRELRFVEVPLRRGGETVFVNVLPQQGSVFLSLPVDNVGERLAVHFSRSREFDDFLREGRAHVTKRMSRAERELYRDRFIERATGRKVPKKPRGLR